jgi:hypothetical protein
VPRIELPARAREHTDRLEADAAMQRDAGLVRQRDDRERVAVAALAQTIEQLAVKLARNAASAMTFVDIRLVSTDQRYAARSRCAERMHNRRSDPAAPPPKATRSAPSACGELLDRRQFGSNGSAVERSTNGR